MRYYRADIQNVNRYYWRVFIRDLELTAEGAFEADVKEEARQIIEETTGEKEFEILWNRV